jgi:hypothetical protein
LAGQLREGRGSESRRDDGGKAEAAQGQLKLHLALLEYSGRMRGSGRFGGDRARATSHGLMRLRQPIDHSDFRGHVTP